MFMILAIPTVNPCSTADSGPCDGNFRRYRFNRATCTCEGFTWGGCPQPEPANVYPSISRCLAAKCHENCGNFHFSSTLSIILLLRY